jgi:hypothetical protein
MWRPIGAVLTLACLLLGACNTLAPSGDATPPEDVIDDKGLGGNLGPSE